MLVLNIYLLGDSVRRFFRKSILTGLLLALAVVLFSGPIPAEDADLPVSRIIKAAGIDGQLEQLSQAILSAIPEDAFPDRNTRSAAAAFLKQQASADALETSVTAAVRESLDADALAKIEQFLDSSVGKKVAKAQRTALEASVLKRVREGRSLVASLGERRSALLKRIITAEQVSETNSRLLGTVIRGLVDGSAAGGTHAPQPKGIEQKINLIQKEIYAEQQSAEETAMMSSAHLLRALDDKELNEFAVFEESEPAVRFRAAVGRGLDQAVYRCAKAIGEYFAKPQPLPQTKPQRAPAERPRSKEKKEGDMKWDIDLP